MTDSMILISLSVRLYSLYSSWPVNIWSKALGAGTGTNLHVSSLAIDCPHTPIKIQNLINLAYLLTLFHLWQTEEQGFSLEVLQTAPC